MRNAIAITAASSAAVLLVAIAGCDTSRRMDNPNALQASLAGPRSVEWYEARPSVLRARADNGRGRIWTLHVDGVDLYDAASDAKLRSISLPDWMWAGALHSCPPDLAIGPAGEVLVSSNVIPVLWRIDPASYQVSRHELAADAHGGREIGFSGLTYSAQQGAFFAVNGLDGSLWRIDASLTRAQNIPLSEPIRRACGLSVKSPAKSRMGAFCVQAEVRDWIVNLAPDYRSAYAQPAACSTRELAPTAQLRTSQKTF